MNVNQKGVRGLIKVIDDLQDQGYFVFPAFDDHSPVDLIVLDQNGKTFRLQVKYREPSSRKKSVRYTIAASSVVNGKKIPINRSMIDGWAVYLSENNKVVYIKKSLLDGKKELTINPAENYGSLGEWSNPPLC